MAECIFIDVGDAREASTLVRALARHGLAGGLVGASDRGAAERESAAESAHPLRVRVELRTLLLACVWFEFDRRHDQLRLDDASLDALAGRAADGAYAAVLASLDDYHDQSRFTTWLAKFAIREAAVAARASERGGGPHLEGGSAG